MDCGLKEKKIFNHGMTRKATDKEKKLKYFLFFAAGEIIFLCSSVKNPWLKNKNQTPFH